MAEGQFLGPKGKFVYTADDGRLFLMRMDISLVLSNSGLEAYDPATHAAAQNAPKRFKPRVVFWRGTLTSGAITRNVAKALVCGKNSATLYTYTSPLSITIDGVDGATTGRRGEKLSFT